MRYENGLTSSVNDYISGILARKIARANRTRDVAAAARSVRAYLEDPATLVTPDFVIRRHIQAEHSDLLPADAAVPDLIHGPNLPWEEAVVDAVATKLFKADLGLTKAAWKNYLTGRGCPKREGLFKIALGLRMDAETTLDLMLALGEEPYNPRSPMDFVCLFCQKQPGRYLWRDVEEILEAFRKAAPVSSGNLQTGTPGMTEELAMGLEDIFDCYLGENQSKQALLNYMMENAAEFNPSGYSHNRMEGFRQLSKALAILYPIYYAAQNDGVDKDAKELSFDPEGYPTFRSLTTAMFQKNGWEDVQWGEKDQTRKLYTFWKGFRAHMTGVDRLRSGGNNVQFLTRQDALVFIYFFITGYQRVKQECAGGNSDWSPAYTPAGMQMEKRLPSPREQLALLETLYGTEDSFGFSYNYALRRLERIFADPDDRERILPELERLVRVVDVFLTELGYQELYLPASFDRFVLLSLLSGNPEEFTPLLLSGLELEELEELL